MQETVVPGRNTMESIDVMELLEWISRLQKKDAEAGVAELMSRLALMDILLLFKELETERQKLVHCLILRCEERMPL